MNMLSSMRSVTVEFSVFVDEDPPRRLLGGQIEGLPRHPHFHARRESVVVADQRWPAGTTLDHDDAIEFLLDWGRSYVAPYEGGGNAYKHTCDVYVFDKESKKVKAFQSFTGDEPPSQTSTPAGSDDYGSKPTQQIVDFLKTAAGR